MIEEAPLAAAVQKALSPGDVQTVIAALPLGATIGTMAQDVRHGLAHSQFVKAVAKHEGIEPKKLIAKVRTLTPEQRKFILDAATRICRLPGDEALAGNGFPSFAAMARFGLVPVRAAPAWGLCISVTSEGWVQWVLRWRPSALDLTKVEASVDDLANGLCGLTRAHALDLTAKDEKLGLWLAYQIAMKTNLRWFRVGGPCDDPVEVIELTRTILMDGIHRGEFKGLALAGVNAPELESAH